MLTPPHGFWPISSRMSEKVRQTRSSRIFSLCFMFELKLLWVYLASCQTKIQAFLIYRLFLGNKLIRVKIKINGQYIILPIYLFFRALEGVEVVDRRWWAWTLDLKQKQQHPKSVKNKIFPWVSSGSWNYWRLLYSEMKHFICHSNFRRIIAYIFNISETSGTLFIILHTIMCHV